MSLTSFIKLPDVRERLKPLRPDIPRKIPVPVLAPPRSNRSSIVGIGFDYLLRFEIERRSARCRSRNWVAEYAPEMLRGAGRGEVTLKVLTPGGGPASVLPPQGGFARAASRAQRAVDDARDAFVDHVILDPPPGNTLEKLAGHAMRLARLDLVFRAGCYDPEFVRAEPEDVQDILTMLAVVPFDRLITRRQIHLDPVFGAAGLAFGGADADMIVGDMLVEVKATKPDTVKAEHLDQLLGYYLLSRRARRESRRFPLVRKLALYYARFGHLLVLETDRWTGHPLFGETEAWFFARAAEAGGDPESQ